MILLTKTNRRKGGDQKKTYQDQPIYDPICSYLNVN